MEHLISPEGAFPVFGRSITYRTGVLQPLALIVWKGLLPEELSNGQVRTAMTAVINVCSLMDKTLMKRISHIGI